MKLTRVELHDYKSIRNSNPFSIEEDVTCLVGKNEAGKTAILQAIYRLNPIEDTTVPYDVVEDYPRSEVEDYRQAVEAKKRDHAIVAKATYTLEDNDVAEAEEAFGKKSITSRELTISAGYNNVRYFALSTDEKEAVKHLVATAELVPEIAKQLKDCDTVENGLEILKKAEETTEVARLVKLCTTIIKDGGLNKHIYLKYIKGNIPKFLYFDEYYQMKGHENIEALQKRLDGNSLLPSDHPLLGLIELARLDNLKELINPSRTEALINRLQGASNHLTRQVLKYWSQNRHLRLLFDVRPARPEDPDGMTSGTNIWARVEDDVHMVTTRLGTRSRGFVWFFSFLAWYSNLKKKHSRLILLLDEPGLSLHGKAQEDLLNFFEEELQGGHQLIYTTHSPFLVDSKRFDRVRIVEDKSLDTDEPLSPEKRGTKVITDILEANPDSLFPLQGAFGYEIYQTLFVGPNSLVVEGVSDLIYVQAISAHLEAVGRNGLSRKWTITPVGGSDKVPTFVSLLGSQKGMMVATLIDIQAKDRQTIDNLYKKKLLKKNNVVTFADFTAKDEADIEDMFETDFYIELVNKEFDVSISSSALEESSPRILVKLERYFEKHPLKKEAKFNHYRPARYFAQNLSKLSDKLGNATLDRFEKAFNTLNELL